jgi:hypothetical protein
MQISYYGAVINLFEYDKNTFRSRDLPCGRQIVHCDIATGSILNLLMRLYDLGSLIGDSPGEWMLVYVQQIPALDRMPLMHAIFVYS